MRKVNNFILIFGILTLGISFCFGSGEQTNSNKDKSGLEKAVKSGDMYGIIKGCFELMKTEKLIKGTPEYNEIYRLTEVAFSEFKRTNNMKIFYGIEPLLRVINGEWGKEFLKSAMEVLELEKERKENKEKQEKDAEEINPANYRHTPPKPMSDEEKEKRLKEFWKELPIREHRKGVLNIGQAGYPAKIVYAKVNNPKKIENNFYPAVEIKSEVFYPHYNIARFLSRVSTPYETEANNKEWFFFESSIDKISADHLSYNMEFLGYEHFRQNVIVHKQFTNEEKTKITYTFVAYPTELLSPDGKIKRELGKVKVYHFTFNPDAEKKRKGKVISGAKAAGNTLLPRP